MTPAQRDAIRADVRYADLKRAIRRHAHLMSVALARDLARERRVLASDVHRTARREVDRGL